MPPKSTAKSSKGSYSGSSSYNKNPPDNTAFIALKRALKAKQLGNLYFFHGEERFLQEYYLKEIRKLLLPEGLEEFNHRIAREDECSLRWLEHAVDSLPMMSERTLVEVEDWDPFALDKEDMPKFLKFLQDIPDYCCLIFIYDTIPYKGDGRSKLGAYLKEHNANVTFNRQEQSDLIAWIARGFRASNHTISNEDARYLIFHCGNDMTNLASEISKLSSYCTQQQITQADINAVTIPVIEAVIFDMTDAIAARDFNKAATVLADLLHSQEPYSVIGAIGKYFRQLYSAKLCIEHYESKQTFMELWNAKPFPTDKIFTAAKKFSLGWCRYAVRRCCEVNIAFRLNYGEEANLLKALLMELSTGRQVVA